MSESDQSYLYPESYKGFYEIYHKTWALDGDTCCAHRSTDIFEI